jgi:hypothetical protein
MNRNLLLLVLILSLVLTGCDFIAGNFVWDDLDMDGIQDPGEPGLAGVTVLIREISINSTISTTTDSMGFYSFNMERDDRSYRIEFLLPDGYVYSPKGAGSDIELDSDADPNTGYSAVFTVNADVVDFENDNSIDAGMYLDPDPEEFIEEDGYSIGDYVWLDSNANGIQDENEDGLADVEVNLFAIDSPDTYSTQTDALGSYEFENMPKGEYQLEVVLPTGYSFTTQDVGSDDGIDSDFDPDTGLSPQFSLGAIDDFNWDAGLIDPESADSGEPISYCVGPDLPEFPEGYSALTGQMVDDPSSLALRPVLMSISLFPPSVRPPTGLSFSPITYQFYIGDGDTRMLATFYGNYPELNPEFDLGALAGDIWIPPLEIPDEQYVISNFVWFDSNGNSLQDPLESGFPDIDIELWVNGSHVDSTQTDANGYYWFYVDAQPGDTYRVKFSLPTTLPGTYAWVEANASSDEDIDSDANIVTGWTTTFTFPNDGKVIRFVDAGIRQIVRIEGVRSGRVHYEPVRRQYCGCLITAGADPTVAAQIQTCGFAASSNTSDIGASGVDIFQLGLIAEQNSIDNVCANPNLSGNLFCTETTLEGAPGQELFTFWNVNNRDHFVYNQEMGAYSWAKNLPAENEKFEILTDGLTKETLYFENVIVMLTNMTQLNSAGTIFEMDIDHTTGKAYIFRNGTMYEALWSSLSTEYEQATGLQQPYRYTDMDGNPFPFAPGQTFVQMLHTFHLFEETGPGIWRARFYAPAYP